ncbi:MAG: SRPBCC family protein [Actinobacteria bacterium]|nr:SRPBCC family protein [Actinomycetota bacterium]
MEGTIRSSETSAATETVFDVAADLAAYPEWVAGVAAVEVLATGADGLATRARFEVEGYIKRLTYVLEYDYTRPTRIAWTGVPGDDIESMEGFYEFRPREGGGTEILYALRVQPAFVVPGFLRGQAEKHIVTNALRGLRRRAEAIEAARPGS